VVALYSLQKNLSNTSKAIASLGKLGVHVSEKDVAPLLLEFYGANGWREEAIELYSSLKATSSPDQPLPASIVGRMMVRKHLILGIDYCCLTCKFSSNCIILTRNGMMRWLSMKP
jgi:hypothetical protein